MNKLLSFLAPSWHLANRGLRSRFWHEELVNRSGRGPDLEAGHEPGVTEPDDGVGPLYLRSYRVRVYNATMNADDLLTSFRRQPNRFSPTSYAIFEPEPGPDGLRPGDELEVKLPGPWDGPVRVVDVTPTSMRLDTRDGHMEAGTIEFTARDVGDARLEFRIRSQARSATPVVNTLYSRIPVAKLVQSQMWAQVLEAAVDVSGGVQEGRLDFQTVVYSEDQP